MRDIWTPKIILPPILTADKRLAAAQTALEEQLRLLSDAALECIFIPRLDELPENVIDLLAESLHVDFYEPLGMDIDTKRSYVRDALLWHRIKGTPAAVERVLSRAFAKAQVAEWFEYGGDPYFFRIYIDITSDDEPADRDTLNRLRRAVHDSQNARSWLEWYRFRFDVEDTVEPTDEHHFTVRPNFYEQYDYGQPDFLYDGTGDYGGDNEYGGITGGSFERWSMAVHDRRAETIEPDEDWFMSVSIASFHDSISPADSYALNAHDFRADHIDTSETALFNASVHFATDVEPIIDSTSFNPHLTLDDRPSLPTSSAIANVTHLFTYDGDFDYGGGIDYGGAGISEQIVLIDADAEARWYELQRELAATFDEHCTCGSSSYDWCMGSIRLGGDTFLESDPQVDTVIIRCSRCGNIISEYLVPNDHWEAAL